MRYYFGFSLLFHLVILLVLYWQNVEVKSNLQEDEFFLTFENRPVKKAKRKSLSKDKKTVGKGKSLKKATRENKSPLSHFVPQTVDIPKPGQQAQKFNHGNGDLSVADNSSAPWGQGGAEFGRLADFGAYEKVAFAIDHMVVYPYQLAYREIGGIVRSRLVVDKKGKCKWDQSYIKGNNPYLRVYVLTLLKQFCRGNFWHGIPKRKSSNIDFSFHFDTYSKEESKPLVNGNVVLFRLPGYQDKGTWRMGPLQGNYIFPNAIFLNSTWIVENWNSLMYEEDPLQRFKEEEIEKESAIDSFKN